MKMIRTNAPVPAECKHQLWAGMKAYREILPTYFDEGVGRAVLTIAKRDPRSNVISFPTRYDWLRAHQVKSLFFLTGFQDLARDVGPEFEKVIPPELGYLERQLAEYIAMADQAVKELQPSLDFGEEGVGETTERGINRAA